VTTIPDLVAATEYEFRYAYHGPVDVEGPVPADQEGYFTANKYDSDAKDYMPLKDLHYEVTDQP
jgi:hypothetical protein